MKLPSARWTKLDYVVFASLVIVVMLIGALYNHFAYDDWTCMFKRCVAIENIK